MTRRVVLLTVLAIGSIGCSGGSTAKAPDTTSAAVTAPSTAVTSTTTTVATTAPTTTPATTASSTSPSTTAAPEPLEAQLQHLLDRYDVAVSDILADPRVASDPANPKVLAYLALFPANSIFAQGALKFWANEGTNGRFYRPGPGGSLSKSGLLRMTTSTLDRATFIACTKDSTEVVDAAGTIVEASGGVTQVSATALKSGSGWLFRDLTQTPVTDCPKPGAG